MKYFTKRSLTNWAYNYCNRLKNVFLIRRFAMNTITIEAVSQSLKNKSTVKQIKGKLATLL